MSVRNPGEIESRREWKVGKKGGIRQPKKAARTGTGRRKKGRHLPIASVLETMVRVRHNGP
jgi:hypothetical protein